MSDVRSFNFDYLIVGLGFGGSVSACRLAESEGIIKISLVEAK